MLAAEKGHKDIVLILEQKRGNLDIFNKIIINVFVNIV